VDPIRKDTPDFLVVPTPLSATGGLVRARTLSDIPDTVQSCPVSWQGPWVAQGAWEVVPTHPTWAVLQWAETDQADPILEWDLWADLDRWSGQ